MEKLAHKYKKFVATLNALRKNIDIFYREDLPLDVRNCVIASTIKHYEMCYEAAWKFLQLYISICYDIKVDSPKKVFRESYILGLIDHQTTSELLDISESRNATTHDYDEETAKEICTRIDNYYLTFKKLENIDLNL